MALSNFLGGRRNNVWDVPDPMEVMVTLFDNTPASSFARDVSAVASTNVDWKETQTEHVFKADLPGLRKEEVKVQIEDGRTLSISGQRQREEVKETDKWHRVERSSGSFMRKFRLPEDANLDQVSAKVDNGVLTVVVPKLERRKETRSIEIGGHDEQPAKITAGGAEHNTAHNAEHNVEYNVEHPAVHNVEHNVQPRVYLGQASADEKAEAAKLGFNNE